MEEKKVLLLLLLVAALVSQGCCQHWSYVLNPGGKRVTDSLSDTLDNVIKMTILQMAEDLPKIDTSCSLFGCADVSPHPEMYRLRALLVSKPR
ncbi:progonadoliberin-1-like [Salvelinus namaycush]|uniref:Progonadoliberin-1-like n=1 Tax=Salvelinus namaycush TaxID=8040 RepID=A0A8U1H1N3_SALNM|nr:progonadoliberin-1-like [Salvelinus namaycush]